MVFINRRHRLSPNQFQWIHMKRFPVDEDLLILNFLLYDIDIVDGNIVWELARGGVQKCETSGRLLKFNNHISYVSNNMALLQAFCCLDCVTFFQRNFQFGATLSYMHWTSFKNLSQERLSNLRNLLQSGLFGIKYTSQQKLFKNISRLDFESFLCSRRGLQRYRVIIVDWEACPNSIVQFFKPCGRTSFPLQLWSSSPCCIFYWINGMCDITQQNTNQDLFPGYWGNN